MTGSAFAQLLRARRIGRGKWQAKCPSHPDRKPSLSISEGKRGVLIRCMSNGCETRDILAALGLTFNDLFFDQMTPQVRARTSLWQAKEDLTVAWQSARMMVTLEPKKRNYWRVVERNAYRDLQLLRCRIEPTAVYQELRGERWNHMSRAQQEKAVEQAWNLHTHLNNGL